MSIKKSQALVRRTKPAVAGFKKGADSRRKLRKPRNHLLPSEIYAIERYLTHGSYTRAHAEAGYAGRDPSRGAAFFKRDIIAKEIRRRLKLVVEKAELTDEWIIERLMKLADANIIEILEKLEANDYDLSCLTFDEKYAVAELSHEIYVERGREGKTVKKFKIKPESRQGALQQLARIRSMFNDKLHVSGAESLVERLQQGRQQAGKADE